MPDLPPKVPTGQSNQGERKKTTARGYGADHQRQRAELLRKFPLCQRCNADWSHQLHHRDRDTSNRHPSNLEMLCRKCHKKEHGH